MVTVANQGQSWLAKAPETVKRVRAMVPQGSGPLGDLFKATEAVRGLTHSNSGSTPLPVEVHSNEPAFTVLGASGYFVGATLICIRPDVFSVVFQRHAAEAGRQFTAVFWRKTKCCVTTASRRKRNFRYLATITLINVGLGVVTAVILWLLQVPNPLLWGVMAATLNYVPHVGAWSVWACFSSSAPLPTNRFGMEQRLPAHLHSSPPPKATSLLRSSSVNRCSFHLWP